MLDLTKLNFEDIVEQLKLKLREKDAWKDVYLSSTGTVLIELFAYVFQLLLYYLKRTYEEQFPATAQFWSSMVRIANMLNVYVERPQGAYGKVKMRLKESASEDVLVFDKYTTLLCDGVKCYLCEDVAINKTEWKEVLVRQGERVKKTFYASGGDFQEYIIDEIEASDRDVVVTVGNIPYEVVTDIFEVTSGYGVRVFTGPDKRMRLQFFRDFGAPSAGEKIEVEYAVVNSDWLPTTDMEWYINQDVEVVLGSLDTWVMGSSFEDLESFRCRFRNYFGTGKRLVTKHDFEKVLYSLGEVEKVKIIDVKDEYKAPFRGVTACVKLKNTWTIPNDFRDMFEQQIVNRIGLLGTKVDLKPASRVDVDVYLVVEKKFGYTTQQIVATLTSEIQKMYKDAPIGYWVSKDDLYGVVTKNGFNLRKLILPDKDMILSDTQLVNLRALRIEVR